MKDNNLLAWFLVLLVILFLILILSNFAMNKELNKIMNKLCKENGYVSYEKISGIDLCIDKENNSNIVVFDCGFSKCKIKTLGRLNK